LTKLGKGTRNGKQLKSMMKFSRAISRVKWLSGELTTQPFDPADSPRELHHTQSPGKQQISQLKSIHINQSDSIVIL
jgi:hypothetical protein